MRTYKIEGNACSRDKGNACARNKVEGNACARNKIEGNAYDGESSTALSAPSALLSLVPPEVAG